MQTNDEPLISCGIMVLEIGRNKLPDKSAVDKEYRNEK